jgi:hypothetical protein
MDNNIIDNEDEGTIYNTTVPDPTLSIPQLPELPDEDIGTTREKELLY